MSDAVRGAALFSDSAGPPSPCSRSRGSRGDVMLFAVASILLFGSATAVFAQSVAEATTAPKSVADILTFLVTNDVRTGSAAIERDREAARATSDTISRALRANLATLPVTTSSGAFVYHLNPELGTVERPTQSFGSFFVERALTAGEHQASVGLTFQHLRFTSLDGSSLRDGSLVTTANQFVDESLPFEVDRLSLSINADIATLYGNVGLTDAVEVGVAIPMVALRLNGSRLDTYYGRPFRQSTATATAIGLADVVVRTKATLFNDDGIGLAAAVDVRLPTGHEEDLLGTGSPSLKLTAIGSAERGRVSAHANVGGSVGGLAREFDYGGALALAATGHVTVSGELLGRWLDMFGHIVQTSAPHTELFGVQTIRLTPDASTLQMIVLVPGIKWNLSDTWVLAANASVPVTSGGLTSRFTPFVGLDYSFAR
jgi:hypothetical protein